MPKIMFSAPKSKRLIELCFEFSWFQSSFSQQLDLKRYLLLNEGSFTIICCVHEIDTYVFISIDMKFVSLFCKIIHQTKGFLFGKYSNTNQSY